MTEAKDGAAAIESVGSSKPDLIILDVMMPVMDGNEVVMRLRSDPSTSLIPIIMLTARAADADKVYGLDIGADDYVIKPFSVNELTARVKAHLRRLSPSLGKPAGASSLKIGVMEIDSQGRKVYVEGREVMLTLKEFDLLHYLANNAGTAFSREKLMDEVWGYDFYGDTRTIDVHITHIRSKIGPDAAKSIETIRGVGYRMALSGGKG